jgi:uncharacterized protein involved in response to NO
MHRTLPLHGALPEPAKRPALAVASKGFRPFFLLAAGFASLVVPIWLLVVSGAVAPVAYLDPASWHAHEMVFGYATAVVAGFLLTAVGNWTQRETLVGAPLLALAALWVLGRAAIPLAPVLPRGGAAAVDVAFLPALLVAVARPLVAARDRRNFVIVAALGALAAANAVVHLDALGLAPLGAARHASLVAVDVIVLLIVVISGRIVPMFTRNATGVATIDSVPALDRLAVASTLVVTLVDAAVPETRTAAAASLVAALLTAARAWRWGTRHTAKHPLLWILHVGYAWVPVGFALRATALFGVPVLGSPATHALTVGAIGALTLGMMARVVLGHTGRALVAPRAMTWAFGAITAAAIVRVAVPLVALPWHFGALIVAGVLWSFAFGAYVVVYAPMLLRPRADGKAG